MGEKSGREWGEQVWPSFFTSDAVGQCSRLKGKARNLWQTKSCLLSSESGKDCCFCVLTTAKRLNAP